MEKLMAAAARARPRLGAAGVLGALLLLGSVVASSASAETFVNRWTQVQLGIQNGAPVAMAGAPGADWIAEPAEAGTVRLKNAATGQYLNVEKGLAVGPVGPGWWSAMWTLEQAGGFVRIKNRWTGAYLNVQQGALAAGAIQPGWWSAQWQVAGGGAPATTASTPLVTPEGNALLPCMKYKQTKSNAGQCSNCTIEFQPNGPTREPNDGEYLMTASNGWTGGLTSIQQGPNSFGGGGQFGPNHGNYSDERFVLWVTTNGRTMHLQMQMDNRALPNVEVDLQCMN